MRSAWRPADTDLSLLRLRFCLVVFWCRWCRIPGERRISLPVPVSLKRFAMDFLVFCMTFRKTENKDAQSPACKGESAGN